jgi:hypothetical protein
MLFSLNFALKEDIFAPFIEKKLPVKFIIFRIKVGHLQMVYYKWIRMLFQAIR